MAVRSDRQSSTRKLICWVAVEPQRSPRRPWGVREAQTVPMPPSSATPRVLIAIEVGGRDGVRESGLVRVASVTVGASCQVLFVLVRV